VVVEHRQGMMGRAGVPDHLGHREQAAPAGDGMPVPESSSFNVVYTTMVTGSPWRLPNWPEAGIARNNALAGIGLRHPLSDDHCNSEPTTIQLASISVPPRRQPGAQARCGRAGAFSRHPAPVATESAPPAPFGEARDEDLIPYVGQD
jgi:hypothetical protein